MIKTWSKFRYLNPFCGYLQSKFKILRTSPNFVRFCVPFFGRKKTNFRTWITKLNQLPITWQISTVISRESSEISWRNKKIDEKTPAVKHKTPENRGRRPVVVARQLHGVLVGSSTRKCLFLLALGTSSNTMFH